MKSTVIYLHKKKSGYTAQFVGGWQTEKVFDLFHTNVIPTGFTAEANVRAVFDAIQQLNPDCEVVVCSCTTIKDWND